MAGEHQAEALLLGALLARLRQLPACPERNATMAAARRAGATYVAIAEAAGICAVRARRVTLTAEARAQRQAELRRSAELGALAASIGADIRARRREANVRRVSGLGPAWQDMAEDWTPARQAAELAAERRR